jgi:hypothetical protein
MGMKLGMEARLYRNTGDYTTPAWTLIPNVKDLTLNLETAEADVTTRANAGWRATIATLKDGSIEFQMVFNSDDTSFTALRDAYLNSTPVEVAVMDGDIATTGSEGLRASCSVTNFARNEALEEAISFSVTLKPTYADNAPEWLTIA